ncbi:MAG: AmmeMemoRadiSam system protein B [Candidatus Omnitrophica bacterium]|nr:AmmeMemoRadiSam system protein B [Candidatus Omnitrophota bacterium]
MKGIPAGYGFFVKKPRLLLIALVCFVSPAPGLARGQAVYAQVKEANVAGSFYPADRLRLSRTVDRLLAQAEPSRVRGRVGMIIVPHAGYEYSGRTAAFAYKLIRGKPYRTVVVISASHYLPFEGVSVYRRGAFRTPLGDVPVDEAFTRRLLDRDRQIFFEPRAFDKDHSLEVQIPFLQRALSGFKIVPVMTGKLSLDTCRLLARRLHEAAEGRDDLLVVVSTDLYHGHDFSRTQAYDLQKLAYVEKLDAHGLYHSLRAEGSSARMCGGYAVVAGLMYAQACGYKTHLLSHTDSSQVTGRRLKGVWTVGYASVAGVLPGDDPGERKEGAMLNTGQRKRLLEIARSSMEQFVGTGRRMEVSESDALLNEHRGAFVTLNSKQGLRGCIGHMTADGPLYAAVRDMAVEAAVRDPRFPAVTADELAGLEIEISVLSRLKRVPSADHIEVGKHGVMVKRGFKRGVYLPQVATDTGWSREEFLSSLCAHKAGLPADAWKDPSTELYVFTAEIFSESHY